MERPPCCDIDGIKKGPWTDEEDIRLASYIQQHGPRNWRSVPTNTGLLRCGKSCRLRWTNYLRPGIKRGNFTTHEDRMIVHLQSLLGNKWASIASYLPQRTDNHIKNYWNTHLKKKMKKFQSSFDPLISSSSSNSQLLTRKYTGKRTDQASLLRLSQASTYASSIENISRNLQGWMNSSPITITTPGKDQEEETPRADDGNNSSITTRKSSHQCNELTDNTEHESKDLISNEDFESLVSFQDMTSTESSKNEEKLEDQSPLCLLEKWLLDESSAQVEEMMDFFPIS